MKALFFILGVQVGIAIGIWWASRKRPQVDPVPPYFEDLH